MEIFNESQGESQHRNQDLLVINGIDKTSLGDLVRKKDTICSFQEYNPIQVAILDLLFLMIVKQQNSLRNYVNYIRTSIG